MYIAFEGPIGAGKTTLAKLLASHLNAQTVLEDFDGNKFLPDFYEDEGRWALAMQLWFLSDRYNQLSKLAPSPEFPIVADYSLAKDRVFAQLLLEDRELELYDRICQGIHKAVEEPTVIVLLDATNEVLLERIRKRGRPYEASITGCYLDDLRRAYDANLRHANMSVLRVDTSNLDINSRTQIRQLFLSVEEIASAMDSD